MPFIIDPETLTIKGRRGDSATFNFNLKSEIDLDGACVHFYVKKNIGDPDSKALIKKEYTDLSQNAISVNLTSADTTKLVTQNNSRSEYHWGLKIHKGIDFAQTLIPSEFQNAPKMYIYPQIVGDDINE